MLNRHRVAAIGIVVLAMLAGRTCYAGWDVNLQTWAQAEGTHWSETEYAFYTPTEGDPIFSHYFIASSDGQYSVSDQTLDAGQGVFFHSFGSLPALISSLPTSWTVTLDPGLPTEHVYHSTVTYGDLSGIDGAGGDIPDAEQHDHEPAADVYVLAA